MKEYAITNGMLRELIHRMRAVFDSHDLIQEIMTKHPQEYTKDLYSFVESTDPIQSLHQSIGQRLLGIDLIEKASSDKVRTTNARRKDNANQSWRRK